MRETREARESLRGSPPASSSSDYNHNNRSNMSNVVARNYIRDLIHYIDKAIKKILSLPYNFKVSKNIQWAAAHQTLFDMMDG